MTNSTTASSIALVPSLEAAWQDVDSSCERFCLTAGISAMEQMLCEDAQQLTGARHSRGGARIGHRWGTTEGPIGFHGGIARVWTCCLIEVALERASVYVRREKGAMLPGRWQV